MKRANSLQKQTKLYISAVGGAKAHGVCRPGRDTAVRRKSFLPYFLYFTKSRRKAPPKAAAGCRRQHKKAACRPKKPRSGENCCGSNRKMPPRAAKGFNFVSAKPPLRRAESRFAKPRNSLRGRTACHFLHRAKSNQKARGTPSCDLDSNRRSIRCFCESDRLSSSNR